MRSSVLCIILLVAAACGSGESSPVAPVRPALLNEQAASGSTLTARWYVVDGWRYFARFEGTSGEGCLHVPDATGATRCLPIRSHAYADAVCTDRVALVDPCASVPLRVAVADAGSCSPGYRVYQVGDPVAGPLYQSTGAGCLPLEVWQPAYSPFAARRLGAEVDPAAFVAASIQDDPPVGGVSTMWLVGTDGSRRYAGVRDAATGVPCGPTSAADGLERCLPNVPHADDEYGHLFGDSACSVRATHVYAVCPRGDYVLLSEGGPGMRVFRIGAAATPYSNSSGACSPASAPAGFETRLLAEEIPAASFARTPYTVLGEQPWQINAAEFPGGRIWSPSIEGGLFAHASDGIRRRFAAYAFSSRAYFADDACTIPLGRVVQDAAVAYAVFRITSTCPWHYRAYQLMAPYTGPVYTGPPCTLASLQYGYELRYVGAEIPPESFAPVSIE